MEEDQKIYDKVCSLVFDEMLKFLEENLSKEYLEKLIEELDEHSQPRPFDPSSDAFSDSERERKQTEILLKYLNLIKDYRLKLDKRLKYFVNNLLYTSLKKV